MKKGFLLLVAIFSFSYSFSQTNTFPATGNVGIGTTNSQHRLAVLMDPLTNGTGVAVQAVNSSGVGSQPGYAFLNSAGNRRMYSYLDINSDTYNIGNANSLTMFTINQLGDIGIGTTTPTEKLSVKGKIRAQEIKVDATNWPDYVFAKNYQLPSLQTTEQYIKDKGHLPGIPSAEEVQANGIDLGEMNAKLLKKIEELTLHLIEKEKELGAQKQLLAEQNGALVKQQRQIDLIEQKLK